MKEEHIKGYKFFKGLLGWLYLFWYNPKIIGKENIPQEGPTLFCGNHRHVMDQCNVMMVTKRMIHYMAKKEYFDGKFAWFFKAVGCISVNRQIKDTESKNHAIDLLNKGFAVGIFPEGTRNKTLGTKDEVPLLPFKYGAVSMASKTDASIVPFGVSGEYKFRSKDLVVKIGKPFKIGNMTYDEANEKLRKEILKLISK